MYSTVPTIENDNTFIFTGDSQGTTGTNCWHSWTKPAGVSFIRIICIGAGGAGGGGYLNDGATNRNGAGGGGSGAVTTVLIPASLIDDALYILPGIGGATTPFGTSATVASNGSGGTASYVSYKIPSTARQYVVVTAAAGGGGNGGLGGTLTVGGAGGTGGAAATLGNHIWASLGIFKSFAGVNGGDGSGVSGGILAGSITPLSSTIVSGGAGSASVGSTGTVKAAGTIVASGILPAIASSGNGVWFWNPMCGTGGSGGGAAAAGGIGAYGCGGGGGGSGALTGGVGTGGRGGDGLVIINCW